MPPLFILLLLYNLPKKLKSWDCSSSFIPIPVSMTSVIKKGATNLTFTVM